MEVDIRVYWHHLSTSPTVIVWTVVGQHLFLNTIHPQQISRSEPDGSFDVIGARASTILPKRNLRALRQVSHGGGRAHSWFSVHGRLAKVEKYSTHISRFEPHSISLHRMPRVWHVVTIYMSVFFGSLTTMMTIPSQFINPFLATGYPQDPRLASCHSYSTHTLHYTSHRWNTILT